jgi:hypothetical protein
MAIEFRPVPGWPRCRIGSDRSVWVRRRDAGPSPAAAARPGGGRARVGSASHFARLDESAVAELRRLHAEGATWRELAERFGVGELTVWRILTGRTWKHVAPGPPVRPRWVRLEPIESGGAGPAVRLYHGGRQHTRSVDLLHRAAFDPESLPPAWLARIGPRPPASPPARLPLLADLPPPYIAPAPLALDRTEVAPIGAAPAVVPPVEDDDDRDWEPLRGESNGRAKLNEDQVSEARRLRAEGWTERALAARFGVSPSGMHYALVGSSWSHVPLE